MSHIPISANVQDVRKVMPELNRISDVPKDTFWAMIGQNKCICCCIYALNMRILIDMHCVLVSGNNRLSETLQFSATKITFASFQFGSVFSFVIVPMFSMFSDSHGSSSFLLWQKITHGLFLLCLIIKHTLPHSEDRNMYNLP